MSNEVKLEDAKPGMWVEFDVKDSERFNPGHYLLELVPPPALEGVEDLMHLNLCWLIFDVNPMKALGMVVDGSTLPVIDDKREAWHDVENLHVYAEKPEPPTSDTDVPEGFTVIGTLNVMSGDAHDTPDIPTEPGLYRAATGSTWYYDGKSWTPITDHKGEWTYAQKQTYKRFIETSLASHRVPFTPISLPQSDDPSPVDDLPTEPGWYADSEYDLWYLDDHGWHSVVVSSANWTASDVAKYKPMFRLDNPEVWMVDHVC